MLMDSSPNKRRKTSHSTSVRLNATSTPNPSKPRPDRARTSPRRASFLSPTKASLARFNPELLAGSQSVGAGARRARGAAAVGGGDVPLLSPPISSVNGNARHGSGTGSRATSLGDGPAQDTTVQEQIPTAVEGETGFVGADESNGSRTALQNQMERAGDTPTSLVPSNTETPTAQRTPAKQLLGSATRVRNRNTLPEPRRSARLSRGQAPDITENIRDDEGDENEPQLPPTPTELGRVDKVMDRAPAGLLSTPTRRSKRARAHGDGLVSSSLGPPSTRKESDMAALGDAEDVMDISGVDETPGQAAANSEVSLQLLQLREEVKQLEIEVSRAQKKEIAANRWKADDLISHLLASNDKATRPSNEPKKEALFSIHAFLPFSRRTKPAQDISSLPVLDDLPSHRPVEVDNPLPYLQVFTPLTFTSTSKRLAPPSTATTTPDLHQQHTITATAPNQLLTAITTLTVNLTTHTITALTISYLSPWAEPELGRWIRVRAAASGPAGKDISSICWAMGRYWELAERRARFWVRCDEAFGPLIEGWKSRRAKSMASAPALDRGDAVMVDSVEDQRETTGPGDQEDPQPHRRFTRRELSSCLGRSSLIFSKNGVRLMIAWHISFDWTGEAESRVSAATAVPRSWSRADSRGSLSKVPEMFHELVKDKGMFQATRIILRLLFPD